MRPKAVRLNSRANSWRWRRRPSSGTSRTPPIAFLFRDGAQPVPVLAGYGNDEEKQHFYDEALPSLVRDEGADGVLVIAEAWSGGQDVLVVFAEQRDGRNAAWITPFTKKFPRRITLGETEGGYNKGNGHMFASVRGVWAQG